MLVVVAATGISSARAEPCTAQLDDWRVDQGSLGHGRSCGAWIGATNGATIAYSFGQFVSKQVATLPYRATVTWRRLGGDARSLELHLLGAAILIGPDRIGLWIDDSTFAVDGFRPLPGHSTRDPHTVSVVQRADSVEVSLDNRVIGRWAFRALIASGHIAVAFKGGRSAYARMWFRDFRIEALPRGR